MGFHDYSLLDQLMKYNFNPLEKKDVLAAHRVNITDFMSDLINERGSIKLGKLNPPYESLWFEWSTDTYLHGDDLNFSHAGLHLKWHKPDSPLAMKTKRGMSEKPPWLNDLGWVVEVDVYLFLTPGEGYPGRKVKWPISPLLLISKDSDNTWPLFTNNDLSKVDELKEAHKPENLEFINNLLLCVMAAVSMMNCQNVSLIPYGSTNKEKSGKKSRRLRTPTLQFNTIKLPGLNYLPTGKLSPGERDVMAQHMVRGHFKTYTADKPLMGKAVGTYWWGYQVRGNRKNGIVLKDYEVGS